MRHLIYLVGLIFVLGIVSCQKDNKPAIYDGILEAHVLKMDTAICASILWCKYNDYFIFSQASGDWLFEVSQLKGDSLVKVCDFIGRGNGPYEMSSARLLLSLDLQKLFVYSSKYLRMYGIPFPIEENIHKKNTWEKIEVLTPNGKHFWALGLSPVQIVDDSTFLAMGGNYEQDYLFSFIESGKEIKPMLDLPFPDDGVSITPIIRWQAYNRESWFVKRPGHNNYAFTSEDANYLCLFQLEDKQVKNVNYVLDEFPDYGAQEDGMNLKRHSSNKLGHIARATKNYIYLLASPFNNREERTEHSDYMGYSRFVRNKLIVFDWNGNRIGTYLLNIPVLSFIVSEDDHSLYGYTTDPITDDYVMVRYELPIN